MVVNVRSLGIHGISGYEVSVECDVARGLPGFEVVGLPDGSARRSKTAALSSRWDESL